MARAIALAHANLPEWRFELPRLAVVYACAIALIAAGQALPI